MAEKAQTVNTGKKVKIIIVEDNKISRKVLESELSVLDAEIFSIKEGDDPIEAAIKIQPSIISISSELNDISGYDLCRKLKGHAETKDIPIVLITQYDSDEDRKTAYIAGAEDICQTPFPKGKLANKIENLVDKKVEASLPQKVLIAEDSDTVRTIISNILKKEGHTVVEARDGAEAWDILAKTKDIDMIVSDINMPNIDGYQLVKLIRSAREWEFVPIIIASTLADKEDIVKLLNSGADDYVIKPFSTEEFLARIKAHQRVHQLYSELKVANKKLKSFNDSLEKMVSFRTLELHEANMEALMMLAVASEYRDVDTGNHVRRISDFTRELTLAMGYSETKAEEVSYCSILHDVGKIGIPDYILKKPGKLTDEEFKGMQEHTIHGESILSNTQFFKIAREISRWHHEKFDGSGYPDGLVEYAIPFHARVTSVADVFDALTTERVYKKAWDEERAYKHILERVGIDFDPLAIEAFEKIYKAGVISRIRKKYS